MLFVLQCGLLFFGFCYLGGMLTGMDGLDGLDEWDGTMRERIIAAAAGLFLPAVLVVRGLLACVAVCFLPAYIACPAIVRIHCGVTVSFLPSC